MIRRCATVTLLLALVPAAAAAAVQESWEWPLDHHAVGQRFDPPSGPYAAGHRGVDIAAAQGDPIRAVGAGLVTFAGRVGGTGVLTIDHGRERSTYQPVRAQVSIGEAVHAGQVVGTLLGAPSHCADACLHLGRVVAGEYLDPLDLLGGRRFQLIDPTGTPPAPPAGAGGVLERPVGGPITSAYGIRVHPVTRQRKLHDGTDFGAACGTPVHAAEQGTVIGRSHRGSYGKQIVIRHKPGLETSYSHLSVQSVDLGERIDSGDIIGRSGSTGLSTGCHLHFMVIVSGDPVDPQDLL
ncbi:M23 family metallopeptidase [Aeromicrobium sp.]|uniref:M23 family metallopeptidase n=1 Tax=Aeromicrobium sp. TaxID=1871063 RepID=UPI003C499340